MKINVTKNSQYYLFFPAAIKYPTCIIVSPFERTVLHFKIPKLPNNQGSKEKLLEWEVRACNIVWVFIIIVLDSTVIGIGKYPLNKNRYWRLKKEITVFGKVK